MRVEHLTVSKLFDRLEELPSYVEIDEGSGFHELEYLSRYDRMADALVLLENEFIIVANGTSDYRKISASKLVSIRYDAEPGRLWLDIVQFEKREAATISFVNLPGGAARCHFCESPHVLLVRWSSGNEYFNCLECGRTVQSAGELMLSEL